MYEHSEVKVQLLKLYLERYLNILNLSPYTSDLNIYDLFCSEGVYDNGGKGSPICILETIKPIFVDNLLKGKTGRFNCLFNDNDAAKVAKLQATVNQMELNRLQTGGPRYENKEYKNILTEVVGEINQFQSQKAFIFIDPYGYKDISVQDIKKLLKSKKTEVLLFLPTQFMFRFEKNGTPQCLKDFIAELLPETEWPTSSTGLDFIENLKDAFRKNVGNDFFVDSFVITRDKNQFFCLFFFTSHIYGFDRMLDSKWQIDEEEGRGWSYEGDSLFNQVVKTANTVKFERNLISFLKAGERTNSDIYVFTLHQGHLTKHTNQILSKLQDENRLIVLQKDGKMARKGSFYINYKDHKNSPDKVKFKIK